jgi:uncharacterized membrane protein
MKVRALVAILAVAYPVSAHFAIARHSEVLTVASLALLAGLILLPGLARGSWTAWLVAPVVFAGIYFLIRLHATLLPLYAPPVLITGFMAWAFAHTLAPGRMPLIERYVRLMHAPDEEITGATRDYARRLTGIWAALLSALSIVNLALALLAVPAGLLLAVGIDPVMPVPQAVWSLFANVLNYLIVALFFVAEYAYRQYRFPQRPYRNIVQFIWQLVALGPRILAEPGRQR